MFVLLDENGQVARFPYSVTDLRRDNPGTSFSAAPSAESLAGFNVHTVTPADPPPASLIERIDHADPVLVDGVWTQAWDVTPLPDEEASTVLWDRVKAIRESMADAPGSMAATPFGTVQVDAKSKQNINGLVTMAIIAKGAGAPFSEPFTLADNSTVTLDADQMIALGVVVGQHVAAVYSRARALRDEIDAAADHSELSAIDVEEGWP